MIKGDLDQAIQLVEIQNKGAESSTPYDYDFVLLP